MTLPHWVVLKPYSSTPYDVPFLKYRVMVDVYERWHASTFQVKRNPLYCLKVYRQQRNPKAVDIPREAGHLENVYDRHWLDSRSPAVLLNVDTEALTKAITNVDLG